MSKKRVPVKTNKKKSKKDLPLVPVKIDLPKRKSKKGHKPSVKSFVKKRNLKQGLPAKKIGYRYSDTTKKEILQFITNYGKQGAIVAASKKFKVSYAALRSWMTKSNLSIYKKSDPYKMVNYIEELVQQSIDTLVSIKKELYSIKKD